MPGFLSRSGSVGRARWVAGCAVAWAAAAASAPAQTVQGTIQDADGLPVSGALVSLETPAGDPSVSTVSGSSGAYRVTAAGAGPYRLRVQRIGFADAVTEEIGKQVNLFVPLAGPLVQHRQQFRPHLFQTAAQQVGKEGMITIPASIVIQGHDEQVGAFQSLDDRLAVLSSCHGVA